MNITPETKSKFQIGHYISIWLFIAGLVVSLFVYGNDLENEQLRADERQKELIKKIDKQETMNQAIQRQLREIRDTQIEIRTRQGQ